MRSSFASRTPRAARQFGFTLVELLVVIAIIGVLVALLSCLPCKRPARPPAACSVPTISSNLAWVCTTRPRRSGYLSDRRPKRGVCNVPRTRLAGVPAMGKDQVWGWLYQMLPVR